MSTDPGSPGGTDDTGGAPPSATEPNPSQQPPAAPEPTPPAAAPTAEALTAAQAEAATWRGRYRDLQGKFDGAVADARKGNDEQVAVIRDRLVRAEVRAAAAGRLADPADAVQFLDTDSFVNAKGEVDEGAIAKAVDELLTRKPYLASDFAPTNGNGHGSADQGARGGKQPVTTADAMNQIIRGAPTKRS